MTLPESTSTKSCASARAGRMSSPVAASTALAIMTNAHAGAMSSFCENGTICGPVSCFEVLERFPADGSGFYLNCTREGKGADANCHQDYALRNASATTMQMPDKVPKFPQRRVP